MAWFNSSYQWKKTLTLDHTKVSGGSNLSSFPVLISFTDADLKTRGNGGKVTNSSGFDIIFTDSTETTKLDHEIESYTASIGAIVMWVRIPTLSASVDTTIYMYFGNSGISTSQENTTGVWDTNFKGVWHLKEDPSGSAPQMKDSTTNSNHLTSGGSMTSGQQVAGQIAGSLSFDGSNDYVGIPDTATLKPSGDMTISFWAKLTQTASQLGHSSIIVYKNHTASPWFSYQLFQSTGGNTIEFDWNNTTPTSYLTVNTTALSAGIWYSVTYVKSGSSGKIYLNGTDDTNTGISSTYSGTLFNSNDAFWLSVGSGSQLFNGLMDETRISSIARSPGWIATEYNNQSSPSTFYSVGATTSNMSFTDALTITDISGGVLQRWPVDALTVASSLAQSDAYLSVDALSVSDLGKMQAWGIDALTIADQSVMGQTGVWTDALTSTDSLTTTDAATALESLSAVSSLLRTQALSSIEALSASSLFAESQTGSFVDGLTISSASTPTSVYSVTETGLSTASALTLTQALQALDALAIASALSGQRNYQTSDQATISSAFSSTPIFAPTDLLTIGSFLLQTETSTWSDVLSISSQATGSGGFAPSDLLSGLSQMQETDAWTMLDALSIADSATWTQDNLGVPTTTYSFLEQLSISSFFAVVISSLFPEGLSASSQVIGSNGYATSDALSILSNLTSAGTGTFQEPLSLADALTIQPVYQPLDQLIISAALQNTSSMQANELLSVLSSLLGTDAIAFMEPLTVTDSSTMTQQITGATYSFLEQLVISSLFNGVQVATFTDAQTTQSSLKIQVVSSFSDLLAIADTVQIAQTSPFVIPLYARSTLTARDGRVVLLCRDGRVILISRGDR